MSELTPESVLTLPRLTDRAFYERDSREVARDLLGQMLVYHGPDGPIAGILVELEAYRGAMDGSSHAYRGVTPRNAVMFGPGGHSYVYFTYGMYHCLNVTSEPDGQAGAVLIRAVEPMCGLEPRAFGGRAPLPAHLMASGPGRLCRAFGLDRAHSGLDMTTPPLYIARRDPGELPVATGPRVGVHDDLPWRYYVAGHRSVSQPNYRFKPVEGT